MRAVLTVGTTAIQNSPFLPQRWPKPSPVLIGPTHRGWPGWAGLCGLDKCFPKIANPTTGRARRFVTLSMWPTPLPVRHTSHQELPAPQNVTDYPASRGRSNEATILRFAGQSNVFFCKCCWRESVRPLQFYCNILPLSYIVDLLRLLFWRSLHKSDNTVLRTLAYLNQNQFIAIASKYGIVDYSSDAKAAIWRCFSTFEF